MRPPTLLVLLACLPACRLGFDEAPRVGPDAARTGDGPPPAGCAGRLTLGAGGTAPPGVHGAGDDPLLSVGPGQVGCIYTITVDGAGGGRGNHDSSTDNADGGSSGRIVFEFVPANEGAFAVVIGGGGSGAIATGTLDDPGPGAGGGGSSEIAFVAGATTTMLAIAGGGGGGGGDSAWCPSNEQATCPWPRTGHRGHGARPGAGPLATGVPTGSADRAVGG